MRLIFSLQLSMPTPSAFRITVTEIFDPVDVTKPDENQSSTAIGRDVFSQSIPATDFDMTNFVLAINKRKRVRKARGKETQ